MSRPRTVCHDRVGHDRDALSRTIGLGQARLRRAQDREAHTAEKHARQRDYVATEILLS